MCALFHDAPAVTQTLFFQRAYLFAAPSQALLSTLRGMRKDKPLPNPNAKTCNIKGILKTPNDWINGFAAHANARVLDWLRTANAWLHAIMHMHAMKHSASQKQGCDTGLLRRQVVRRIRKSDRLLAG